MPCSIAETDEEGRFYFEQVEAGDYDVALRAPGCAPLDRARLRVPVHERFDLGEFVMRPGVVVAGRVVDSKGAGVADVVVLRATSPDGGSLRLSVPGFGAPVATSDAEGNFRVDTLAPGGWHLIFDSPAYRVVELRGRTERAGAIEDGLVVRLDTGLSIAGRIEGLDPLERTLRVVARPTDEQPSGAGDAVEGAERDRPRHALVAADKSFTLAGLAPSIQYRLRLESERPPDPEAPLDALPTARFELLREVDSVVAMAGAREVVLARVATASVSYKLVDAESGAAVSRAFVSVQGRDLRGDGQLSDAAGEPQVDHPGGLVRHEELRPAVAGASTQVRVNADGYAAYEGDEFMLRPGEERDLGELRLRPGVLVPVRVIDSESELPIAGARVLIAPAGESEQIQRYLDPESEREPRTGTPVRMALTDEQGRCRVTANANEVCVLRGAERVHLASEEVRSLPPHADEVVLRLEPAGSVVVRVLDPRSEPIAGVYVQHVGPGGPGRSSPWDTDARARQTSDEAGVVRFARLEAGSHRFEVGGGADMNMFGPQPDTEPEASESVQLRSGEERELELRLAERGGFRGILLEAGVPLAGALARLTAVDVDPQRRNYWRGPGMSDPYSAISDHEGRIEFTGLSVKRYELGVTHPERRMTYSAEVQVVPAPREERIELGLASIEGRVTGESGQSLEGLRIYVSSGEGRNDFGMMDFQLILREDDDGDANFDMNEVGERRVETDRDGRYVLRGVRPDEKLRVSVSGEYVTGDTRELAPLSRDEVRRGVDFSLRAAGRLEVQLTGLPQGDRNRYTVRLTREVEEGEVAQQSHSQVRGWRSRTTMSSLLPGTWNAELLRGKDVVGLGQAEVVAGMTRELSIPVQ